MLVFSRLEAAAHEKKTEKAQGREAKSKIGPSGSGSFQRRPSLEVFDPQNRSAAIRMPSTNSSNGIVRNLVSRSTGPSYCVIEFTWSLGIWLQAQSM
jgi:hypothetical protein